MSWHFLQEQEEASWEANSLDGAPSALSKLIPMPGASSSPDSATEALDPSQSGMTCGPSTEDPGEAMLGSSLLASPVRASVLPTREGRDLTMNDPACSLRQPELLARFDPTTCSWKTPQTSLTGESDEFSGRWPRWGMWDATGYWAVKAPAWTSRAKGCGLLRRPQASDGKAFWVVSMASTRRRASHPHRQLMLIHQVLLSAYGHTSKGVANVPFWESLMGLPIGWTDCASSATCNLRSWSPLQSDQSSVA
jgi:hypothetical protein